MFIILDNCEPTLTYPSDELSELFDDIAFTQQKSIKSKMWEYFYRNPGVTLGLHRQIAIFLNYHGNWNCRFISCKYDNLLTDTATVSGMGFTVYYLVKAGSLMGKDNFGFNTALKGRISAQAATVGFICLGALVLQRESYEKQIKNEIVTGKLFQTQGNIFRRILS